MFNVKLKSDEQLVTRLRELGSQPWNTLTTWERGLITRLINECKRRGIDYVATLTTQE